MAFILASGPAAAAAAAVAVTAAAATAQLAASAQEVLDPCTIITAAVITLAVHLRARRKPSTPVPGKDKKQAAEA
eukprot:1158094-Pelagomonas_calceolata.AAC.2